MSRSRAKAGRGLKGRGGSWTWLLGLCGAFGVDSAVGRDWEADGSCSRGEADLASRSRGVMVLWCCGVGLSGRSKGDGAVRDGSRGSEWGRGRSDADTDPARTLGGHGQAVEVRVRGAAGVLEGSGASESRWPEVRSGGPGRNLAAAREAGIAG